VKKKNYTERDRLFFSFFFLSFSSFFSFTFSLQKIKKKLYDNKHPHFLSSEEALLEDARAMNNGA